MNQNIFIMTTPYPTIPEKRKPVSVLVTIHEDNQAPQSVIADVLYPFTIVELKATILQAVKNALMMFTTDQIMDITTFETSDGSKYEVNTPSAGSVYISVPLSRSANPRLHAEYFEISCTVNDEGILDLPEDIVSVEQAEAVVDRVAVQHYPNLRKLSTVLCVPVITLLVLFFAYMYMVSHVELPDRFRESMQDFGKYVRGLVNVTPVTEASADECAIYDDARVEGVKEVVQNLLEAMKPKPTMRPPSL